MKLKCHLTSCIRRLQKAQKYASSLLHRCLIYSFMKHSLSSQAKTRGEEQFQKVLLALFTLKNNELINET